jgi:hypothetical protein
VVYSYIMKIPGVSLILCALTCSSSFSAEVKPRDAAVRKDRDTVASGSRWIYNDYQSGFAEAKRTSKPVLVVLRCVPCQACAGIDAAVLLEDSDMTPLLDQFVLVRVVDANALDLRLFQIDYDLSFSAVFFNGDGTVYGRYGSWRHQKDPLDKTTTGFRRAIETALAIHKGYPANKESLVGKQGGPMPFKTPVEIPALAAKHKPTLDWDGQLAQSCVHCHQVGEALRENLRAKNQPLPDDMIYAWPSPETIGLALAADEAAKVEAVEPGSPAAKAGLKPGDKVISLDGQPLISIADASWVLQRAPDHGSLTAVVNREGASTQVSLDALALPSGWRKKADLSRRVATWGMRGMALGGMVLEDLSDATRKERGIEQNRMALFVKSVGQYGKHAAAKNAGFKKDDVIVELAGKSARVTESELLGDLLQHHFPGEQVKATMLRGSGRVELSLPMQ